MYGIKVFGVALWVPQNCFLEIFSKCEGFEFGPFLMVKLSPILMFVMVALASMDNILEGGSLASDEIRSSVTRSVSCHNTSVLENCEDSKCVGFWVYCACAYDARLPMPIEGFCLERTMPFTD